MIFHKLLISFPMLNIDPMMEPGLNHHFPYLCSFTNGFFSVFLTNFLQPQTPPITMNLARLNRRCIHDCPADEREVPFLEKSWETIHSCIHVGFEWEKRFVYIYIRIYIYLYIHTLYA